MKKQIKLQNKQVTYTFKRSNRARRMRLAVYCDGSVVVTAPLDLQENVVEKFIREKTEWLFSKLLFFSHIENKSFTSLNYKDYLKHKEDAFELIQKRVDYFAIKHEFTYTKINIKNQKTCWGSCSRLGNLNFNYKIKFLPEDIQDYIIIHELCHLRYFDHSKNFWNLVGELMPEYRIVSKQLTSYIK